MKNPRCPKCGKIMELAGKDLTENTPANKHYDRVIYTCKVDDVWVTIETPQKTA